MAGATLKVPFLYKLVPVVIQVMENAYPELKESKPSIIATLRSEEESFLKTLGYKKIDIFGAKLGAFSRKDKLDPDYYGMLVIAEK